MGQKSHLRVDILSVNFLYLQSFLLNFSALRSVRLYVRPYVPLKKMFFLLSVLLSALVEIFDVSRVQDFFPATQFFVHLKNFFKIKLL